MTTNFTKFKLFNFVRYMLSAFLLFITFLHVNAQIQEEVLVDGNSWTVPAGVFQITVECWGAGGGGGQAQNLNTSRGGGGGGAYAKKNTFAVTPGTSYNYSIGIGGSGNNTSGNAGPTWFNTTTFVYAQGGVNNARNNNGASGGLAANCVGDVKYSGGTGANRTGSPGNGGGGGAGAGSSGPNGNNGSGNAGGLA
jgi:hypothetical protein